MRSLHDVERKKAGPTGGAERRRVSKHDRISMGVPSKQPWAQGAPCATLRTDLRHSRGMSVRFVECEGVCSCDAFASDVGG